MTALAMIRIPLLAVDRGPHGVRLAATEGKINGWPVSVSITISEIHIAFADRDGPAFTIDLNALLKTACDEIEAQLGVKPRFGSR